MNVAFKLLVSSPLVGVLGLVLVSGCAASEARENAAEARSAEEWSSLIEEAKASSDLAEKLDGLASLGWSVGDWSQAEERTAPDGRSFVAVPVADGLTGSRNAGVELHYVPAGNGEEAQVIAVPLDAASRTRLRQDIATLMAIEDGEDDADAATVLPNGTCGSYFCTQRSVNQGYWFSCLPDFGLFTEYRRECGYRTTDRAGRCNVLGMAWDLCANRAVSVPSKVTSAGGWRTCGGC